MLRALHRWPGLVAAVLLSILGLTGAALSLYPVLGSAGTETVSGQSVADLATLVLAQNPSVAEIDRDAQGRITAWLSTGSGAGKIIDPTSGASLGDVVATPVQDWLVALHRSLFLSDTGRIVMALAALAMIALGVSGLALLARRSGGWRRIFAAQQGKGRLHATLARVTVLGLVLSAVTALWMTAATFELLPVTSSPDFPAQVSGQTGISPSQSLILQEMPVAALDRLVFPATGDATDVFTLETAGGQGFVDQGTGQLLAWSDASAWDRATRLMTALHTGRGAALMGLVLGLAALGLPVMSWTGVALVMARRRRGGRSAPAGLADVVVLVGSEGGTTWGFAETLRLALVGQGLAVHVAPLSEFAPDSYAKARIALILAATYGEGEAPGSAAGFLDRVRGLKRAPRMPLAVLGFGDRGFAAFCGFARQISAAASEMGWDEALPLATVDRQSAQDFARWGHDLAPILGVTLDLHHMAERPATLALTLISRRDYGQSVQAPSAILRFALPEQGLWQRLTGQAWRFRAGDLLGICPEGSSLPRFYSLASGRGDGFVEICVRKHPGGLCSGQLVAMEPGDTAWAFLRPNRGFHPVAGDAPVILIGAGTGIGPLAGFARANAAKRPMHLFFGLRNGADDMLYAEEVRDWLRDGHLRSFRAAFSRGAQRSYVQDEVRRDARRLAKMVQSGAQILVCGGRDMAAGVRAALEDILTPVGLSPALLKAEGRYAEDIF